MARWLDLVLLRLAGSQDPRPSEIRRFSRDFERIRRFGAQSSAHGCEMHAKSACKIRAKYVRKRVRSARPSEIRRFSRDSGRICLSVLARREATVVRVAYSGLRFSAAVCSEPALYPEITQLVASGRCADRAAGLIRLCCVCRARRRRDLLAASSRLNSRACRLCRPDRQKEQRSQPADPKCHRNSSEFQTRWGNNTSMRRMLSWHIMSRRSA